MVISGGICGIFETKKTCKGIIPCNDYVSLFSGWDKDTRGKVVGILIHKKFEQYILNYRFFSVRIMVLSLKRKMRS